MVQLQKRRRKRRKGYAEYAIIPKKKNSLLNVKSKTADAQDTPTKSTTNETKSETKRISTQENSTTAEKENTCLSTENIEQNILETDAGKNNIITHTSEELLLYVNDFVENIVQQAIQKCLTKFKPYCSISPTIPGSTLTAITSNDCGVNNIIVEELLHCILNKVVEESNRIANTLKSCTPCEITRNSTPEENIPLKNQVLDQKCNYTLEDQNFCEFADLNEHKDVSYKKKRLCEILPIPAEQGTIDNFDNHKLNTDEKFAKSALTMNFPHVHKKVPSSSENERISFHEKPKIESRDITTTENKLAVDVTKSSIISKPSETFQIDATSECNNNDQDFLHRNTSVIEENFDNAQQLNDITENKIKNGNSLNEPTITDQVVRIKSELPSCRNNSTDHKQQTKLTGICKETVKSENNDSIVGNSHLHNELNDCNKQYDNSPSSQYSFVSHSVSSEALLRETEIELNKIHQLTSHSNQSIYKLAYDENITDQSETEELDSSHVTSVKVPTCPESCKSLQMETCRSEILVHEVDSASDAGSEDVELLPHRYESDSAKGCNKHIYVNNLSLAVELLRTRENLPYDDEFKRIVNDDIESKTKEKDFQDMDLNLPLGLVNKGFVDDMSPVSSASPKVTNHKPSTFLHMEKLTPDAHGKLRHSITDSGVQSEDSGDEIGEEAKETFDKQNDVHCNSNTTANYRRFGAQAGQRFNIYTPRTNMMNPCFCCIIM